MNKLAALTFLVGAAACAPETPASTGGSSSVDSPDTTGSITVVDGELMVEGCDNAADCEMATTHEACEQIIEMADGNRVAEVQVDQDPQSLVSLDRGFMDQYDTSDSLTEGLPHFDCTQLFIDNRDDTANGGEWIVSGDTTVNRDGDDLTVQVAFDDLFDYATAVYSEIGVLDGSTPRWTKDPEGDTQGKVYIVEEDGTIIN